ncbi:MAG TPA: hypothetical protein VK783_05835 [Bacteroidia bacterium]|nr:hypothetical protein [Bacteroidia bacterium]
MRKSLKYIGIIGALLAGVVAFGQHKNIDTIEYRVVQQANANIANGAKLNSNPAIADTMKPSRKVDYTTINNPFSTTYIPQTLQAVQLKGEPLDKLEHSFLNVGGGNYNTAYLEYFFNSLRSKDWDYGIHLNHLSSDYKYNDALSNFNYNDINLFGKHYMQNHIFTASADFDEHMVHDYGYNTTENIIVNDVTKQQYNLFAGALQYTSQYKDSSKINHDIKVSYYNYSESNKDSVSGHNTIENNFDLDGHISAFVQKQKVDIKFMAQYYGDNYNNGSTTAWNLCINPYVATVEKHWDAHIGLKAYLDAVNGGTTIEPDLRVRYHIADNAAIAYAGIDGDRQYNSYRSLTTMNPFLQDTINYQYTTIAYHIFLGFTGSITNQLTYDVNGSESQVKNMPLFITDTNEFLRNRFTVVYDNVQELNAHGELGYRMKEDIRFTLSGDWYQYSSTNQLETWYHPTLKINLLGEYTLMTKYILRAELYYVNSQYAPEYIDGVLTAKQLSGYPDLNLGVDYKYNKFFTAFLHLNNLANTAYMQWDNYPTQRFNFMLGARLTF